MSCGLAPKLHPVLPWLCYSVLVKGSLVCNQLPVSVTWTAQFLKECLFCVFVLVMHRLSPTPASSLSPCIFLMGWIQSHSPNPRPPSMLLFPEGWTSQANSLPAQQTPSSVPVLIAWPPIGFFEQSPCSYLERTAHCPFQFSDSRCLVGDDFPVQKEKASIKNFLITLISDIYSHPWIEVCLNLDFKTSYWFTFSAKSTEKQNAQTFT